jgi:hypothetical protein
MSKRAIGGYGDPHTWCGRDPYQEDEEEPAIDTRDGSECTDFEFEVDL